MNQGPTRSKPTLTCFFDFDPKTSGDEKKSKYVFLANLDPDIQLNILSQVESPKLTMAGHNELLDREQKGIASEACFKDRHHADERHGSKAVHGVTPNLIGRRRRQMLEMLGPRYVISQKKASTELCVSQKIHFFCPVFPHGNLDRPDRRWGQFAAA